MQSRKRQYTRAGSFRRAISHLGNVPEEVESYADFLNQELSPNFPGKNKLMAIIYAHEVKSLEELGTILDGIIEEAKKSNSGHPYDEEQQRRIIQEYTRFV